MCHRLISRDRPTKTGSLCLWSTFFYVAALSVRILRVVDGGWGGTIVVEEDFCKDNFLFVQTKFTDLLYPGFEPIAFQFEIKK